MSQIQNRIRMLAYRRAAKHARAMAKRALFSMLATHYVPPHARAYWNRRFAESARTIYRAELKRALVA